MLAGFVVAQVAWWFVGGSGALNTLHAWWRHGLGDWPNGSALNLLVDCAGHANADVLPILLGTVLVSAAVLVPLGFVARTLARASLRAGHSDPLDRARNWIAAHGRWSGALTLAIPGAWGLNLLTDAFGWCEGSPLSQWIWICSVWLIVVLVAQRALLGVLRTARDALLAPTLDAATRDRSAPLKDEITFDAVAVTRETRAAVGGMLAVDVVMTAWLATLSQHALYHDRRVGLAVGAFVLVALGGAVLFRRASRVAVGADGVLVRGTSRTRFFGYRDLDAARVSGGDLELVRKNRVVLRLQLHGEDAEQRDAVLSRIRGAIDRVKQGDDAAALASAQGASVAALTRASAGGGDFRAPAVSREALWRLVEGPTTDATTRATAAEALAGTIDASELPRLRVAAAHCAEPRARIAMERVARADAGANAYANADADADASGSSRTIALAKRSA